MNCVINFFKVFWLLATRNFFTWEGRANRLEYLSKKIVLLLTYLLLVVVVMALMAGVLGSTDIGTDVVATAAIVFVVLVGLAISWVEIVLSIRRLHDMNLCGWWLLAIWVAAIVASVGVWVGIAMAVDPEKSAWFIDPVSNIVGFIPVLVFLFWPGSKEANKYGDLPNKGCTICVAKKEPEVAEAPAVSAEEKE